MQNGKRDATAMNQLLSDIQNLQQLDFSRPLTPVNDPALAEIGEALESLRVILKRYQSRMNEQLTDTVRNELVHLIAHELRNPLNSIIGFASLMIEESDITDEERIEYLSIIKQNGHSMNEMITRFLTAQHFDPTQDNSPH
ncbi:MAG: histidine kinase dimerization/phospho-acceptor domain-containing protein [Bacteroidota bacterium]